ncbi:phosphatase, partial [Streptomyces sp. NPDC006386]
MNRFVAAERALRTAAPHELLSAVRRVLSERYEADAVELFMADYGLTVAAKVYRVRPSSLRTTY